MKIESLKVSTYCAKLDEFLGGGLKKGNVGLLCFPYTLNHVAYINNMIEQSIKDDYKVLNIVFGEVEDEIINDNCIIKTFAENEDFLVSIEEYLRHIVTDKAFIPDLVFFQLNDSLITKMDKQKVSYFNQLFNDFAETNPSAIWLYRLSSPRPSNIVTELEKHFAIQQKVSVILRLRSESDDDVTTITASLSKNRQGELGAFEI